MSWMRSAGAGGPKELDFRALAEWSPSPIFAHRDGRLVWLNPAAAAAIGARDAKAWTDAPLDRFVIRRERAEAGRIGVTIRPLDGAAYEAVAVAGAAGEVELLALPGDPAAMRDLQRALAASEARFRNLVEGSIQGVIVVDENWKLLFANEQAARLLGYASAQELLELPSWELLLHPSERERARRFRDMRLRGEPAPPQLEYLYVRKDGSPVPVLNVIRATIWEGRFAFQGTIFDLTERRAAERAALASERRLLDFAEASSDWLWETDPGHTMTYVSADAERVTHAPRAEMIGVRIDLPLPGEAEASWRARAAALAERRSFRDLTYSRRFADGSTHILRASGKPVFDEAGAFQGYRGVTRDVTQEVEARQAAEAAERRLEATLEGLPAGVAMWGPDDRLVYANGRYRGEAGPANAALRVGVSFEEYMRASIAAGFIAEAQGREEMWLSERLARHRAPGAPFEVTRGDWVLLISEVRLPDGSTLVCSIEITEKRRREEDLRQAQKMEAVGQLTGGIAHDFNNLLLIILGNVDALVEQLPVGGGRRRAQSILAAARKGAELVRMLLAFSRRQQLAPATFDAGESIRGLSRMLGRALGEHIAIRLDLSPEPARIHVDPVQFETALLNLAVNARDAMRDGGELTFRTRPQALDGALASRRGLPPGDFVFVSVEDTGAGMVEEVRARAFEPFFTTKEIGAASGLGLSMVYGFAKQSGGHVEIDSQIGAGTRVVLAFPSAREPAVADESSRAAVAPGGDGRTILVVEDEPAVRELVAGLIGSLGYRALEAPDGQAALEILESGREIDLLFTDLIMRGGMSGHALARAARQVRPALRLLYTTGFSPDAAPTGGQELAAPVLPKPYDRAELAAALRAALDGPAPA